ncbi:MAG TPA: hypothetical protein VHG10_05465, partial [Glycomyces sp.]|nr:hypothetical protein [Glycomyces sp.]
YRAVSRYGLVTEARTAGHEPALHLYSRREPTPIERNGAKPESPEAGVIPRLRKCQSLRTQLPEAEERHGE